MTAGDVPKAGRREWIGLAALALPTFIVAIDIFVLLLALPNMAEDLGATGIQQLWITDIYGFLLAGFTLTAGTLGDRIGRRKLLLIGATAFAVISVVSAYSTSPEMLIAARALLGISGATLMPSTLALIAQLFQDNKQRATAFGLWGGTFTLGMIVGPVIGGVLLANFWWGSVFLLGVPFMVLLLIVGPKVLPENRNPNAGKLDPLSVLLSLATMLPVIWGIKELSRDARPLPVVAIVVGVIAGVWFGRRQNRLADPLLDLGLFKNRAISATLVSQLAYSVTGGGVMLFMMMYFQLVDGLSTLQAALAMVPGLAAATIGFSVTPKLATKFKPAHVIAIGMAGTAVVLAVFSQAGADATALLIVGFAVFSFCGSALVGLGMNLIMGSAPPEKMGSAGSMAQMSNEFGGTLGGALLGTIGFAVYRGNMSDALLPAGVSDSAAASARDSLAGASTAASGLPEQVGSALLSPARDAFANGLNTVAGIGAILLAGVAILMGIAVRHVPPMGQADQGAQAEGEADAPPDAAAPEAA